MDIYDSVLDVIFPWHTLIKKLFFCHLHFQFTPQELNDNVEDHVAQQKLEILCYHSMDINDSVQDDLFPRHTLIKEFYFYEPHFRLNHSNPRI